MHSGNISISKRVTKCYQNCDVKIKTAKIEGKINFKRILIKMHVLRDI